MAFWRKLFGSQQRADNELLANLLKLQSDSIHADAEIRKLDREITLRTKALELENLERVSEQRRKDDEAREKMKQQRREWSANARSKLNQQKAQKQQQALPRVGVSGCVVCADPSSPNLTGEEIGWHLAGHPGAMAQ